MAIDSLQHTLISENGITIQTSKTSEKLTKCDVSIFTQNSIIAIADNIKCLITKNIKEDTHKKTLSK